MDITQLNGGSLVDLAAGSNPVFVNAAGPCFGSPIPAAINQLWVHHEL